MRLDWHPFVTGWAVVFLLAASVVAEDWPTYQQNNARNAKTRDQLATAGLRKQWAWQSPGPPNPAWYGPAKWDAYAGIRGLRSMRNYDPVFHPIMVGDSVYFGSSTTDTLYCVDRLTGEVRWTYTVAGPIRVAPTYWQNKLYFGSDDGHVYCLRSDNGHLLWKFSVAQQAAPAAGEQLQLVNNGRLISFWPVRSGVLIEDKRAYFAASLLPWKTSYLACVDAETGKVGDGGYLRAVENQTMEGPLLTSKQWVVVPQGRVAPVLFDRKTGKSLGSLQGGGGSFVVMTPETIFHGPGNKTGWITSSRLNSREKIANFKQGNAIVIAGPISYILTDEQLAATDYLEKRVLWQTPCDGRQSLILAGDTLVVGGVDVVQAFSRKTGKRLWQHQVAGTVHGLASSRGQLVVSTDRGQIVCFGTSSADGSVAPPAPKAIARSQKLQPAKSSDNGSADNGSADDGKSPADALPPIPDVADATLTNRWVFRASTVAKDKVADQAGKLVGTVDGAVKFATVHDHDGRAHQGLLLDGSTRVVLQQQYRPENVPTKQMTIAAWIRIDQAQSWGAILGCIQDNGSYERGWLLGIRDDKFCFAVVADQKRLNYMSSPKPYQLQQWYHVVGTYDGQQQRLFVDGQLVAKAKQTGEIAYPPRAFYELGAYHDQNENYPLHGQINEVRVYKSALSADQIAAMAQSKRLRKPDYLQLASGPRLRFRAPGMAMISWETSQPLACQLEFETPVGTSRLEGTPVGVGKIATSRSYYHQVGQSGFQRHRIYRYRIRAKDSQLATRWYELDTLFDYTAPVLATRQPQPTAAADAARMISDAVYEQTHTRHGMAVLLGCDVELALELARHSQHRVLLLHQDQQQVQRDREYLLKLNVYGTQVHVRTVDDLSRIPFTSHFANLVVVDSESMAAKLASTIAEAGRLVSPVGRLVLTTTRSVADWNQSLPMSTAWQQIHRSKQLGTWLMRAGTPFAKSSGWTHLYGDPSNAAYAGESLSSAGSIGDLQVQWLGRPGSRYQPDRNGRKPAPLSAGGRLYLQGLQRLIGLDAYNGSVLWAHEIPRLGRFNMPRDCANWCADELGPNRTNLFVAIAGRCWRIDGNTGEFRGYWSTLPLATNPGSEAKTAKAGTSQPSSQRPTTVTDARWGFVARTQVERDKKTHQLLIGSSVKTGSQFESFWGGANQGWYDAKSGDATAKVCSFCLFAYDVAEMPRVDSKPLWVYRDGMIINSTITMAEDTIYFVESTAPGLVALEKHRLTSKSFWNNRQLVALDSLTGKVKWTKKITTAPGDVVYYMAYQNGLLVTVGSGAKQYHIDAFHGRTGEPAWSQKTPWPSDNHGGHMSRPAMVGGQLYVRPRGFDLKSGKPLPIKIPMGGCGTYACTTDAIFFRSRNVAMWNRQSGEMTKWNRLRPDCWLSTIPAGGMLLSPEGGGGCSCGSWLETSLGFIPKVRLQRKSSKSATLR